MRPSAGGLAANAIHSIDFAEVEKRVMAHLAEDIAKQARRGPPWARSKRASVADHAFLTPTARVSFPRPPIENLLRHDYEEDPL